MKFPFEMQGNTYLLEPYNTFKEKEILLSASFDVYNLDRIFDIIGFGDYQYLSEQEKKVLLYKYREISLGDEIDIKFKCDNCGQGNDGTLDASSFYKKGIYEDKNINIINVPVSDENLQDFVQDINVDDLDILEYESLKQRVIDNQPTFDFIKSCKCLKCGVIKKFDLSSNKYIIDIMSDDSLMTLYKSYNFLIFFGNYTKQDVDNMYPFERSIFIGLLNKTKEDLSK